MDNLIIRYLINKNNEFHSKIQNKPLVYDLTLHSIFSNYIINEHRLLIDKTVKYQLYKDLINSKFLLLGNDKERALEIFSQYQKVMFSFNKFKQQFKFKYLYTKFDYDYDMQMNELSSYKSNKLVTIVQNKTKYTFALNDILKIIQTALVNMENMVQYPYMPRNPFTNVDFTYCDLCNIYNALFNSNIKLRTHILDFYNMGFDIGKFSKKYRIYVLENYIKNDFLEIDDITTYMEIFDMFEYARRQLKISTISLEHYENVNTHYIEFMKNHFKKALFYYSMITVIDDEVLLKFYTDNFIKYFNRVFILNQCNFSFEEFEKNRINKEHTSLFSKKPFTGSLFGRVLAQPETEISQSENPEESAFGANPFT